MVLDHRAVDRADFGAGLVNSGAGSEATEKFGHAMDTTVLHGGGEMVRTGDNVGDDFSIRGIGDGGFEDTDHRGGPIAKAAAETKGLPYNGRVALKRGGPEMIGQDDDSSGFGTVVLRADETPKDRTESDHIKIGTVNDAGANFPWFSEADHRETNCGELSKGAE